MISDHADALIPQIRVPSSGFSPESPGGRARDKICTHDELLRRRADARAAGRRVVHCHGCFDLVHPGHIRHLRFAKAQGDVLLVSISGDEQVRKGTGRPLIPEELRAENLAALDCVDWVHVEPRPTAAELLDEVRPDVYIKGKEYETNRDPCFMTERAAVERHGGRVVFSSGDVVFSSSALIEAITSAAEGSVDPGHRRLVQLASRPELEPDRLHALLGAVRGKRVLVVGEIIRDAYVFCERPEVAGEGPMMTLRPVEHRVYDGGAAIIARHAAALGAHPTLVTALPEDATAAALRMSLQADGVDVRAVPTPNALPEKQRFLVGTTKVMKLDLVEPDRLDAAARDELVRMAGAVAALDPFDAAIVADFGLGLLTPKSVRGLCAALRPHCEVLAGDVSGRRAALLEMRDLDLITPSEDELRDATRDRGDALPAATWRALSETNTAAAIVTMGPEGLVAFERLPEADLDDAAPGEPRPPLAGADAVAASHAAGPAPDRGPGAGSSPDAGSGPGSGLNTRLRGEHVPAFSPHAVDPLGCGDALLTTAALSLASGGSLLAAAYLGAAAASVQSRRLGNLPVDAAALRREVARVGGSALALTDPGVVETRRAATLAAS